jgi:hypothetical protein
MYAKATPSKIYHVLSEGGELTLCGKSVFNMEASLPSSPHPIAPLHKTSNKPKNRTLCLACASAQKLTIVPKNSPRNPTY